MLLLVSCSEQDKALDIPAMQKNSTLEPYSGIARDIWINVLANRYGGYFKGRPNTRAEGTFTITPHVQNGDTLMYIVQHENGWELYSASKANNMIIMASEKGVFNFNDPDMPDAMRDIILLSCEENKKSQDNSLVQDNVSWGATAMVDSRLSKGKVRVKQKNGTQSTVAYSDLPPGRWVLIETVTEVTDQYDSPKLIQTEWHQGFPWDKYAKRVCPNGYWQSCPAGCVPIAVSQYMYYTHFKDNVPSLSVSTATLSADGSDYEFSNPTAALWSQMALSDYGNGNTDYAAFIDRRCRTKIIC